MKKRLTALLLVLCLIISAAPVFAGAATGQQVSANAVTVTAGNTASVTLRAENFENIAALDVYVYYDASVFTVSGTANGSMLAGAQASVNTAEAGTVKLSAMALDGISGTGNLLTIRLATAASCAPGTYPITVAVGRAHDESLAAAEISGISGSVTVNQTIQTECFYLSGSVSASTARMGDTLSCNVYNSGSRSFVSGEFIFTYDHELFSFESVTLSTGLTGEGAVYSANSSVLGQVRIAYANDTAVSSRQLFTVNLKVVADTETTSTVKAQASNMYRADLSMYQPDSWSRTVSLKKLQLNDYPDAFLRSKQMIAGQESTSVFCLEAGTGIAAADFTLTYDPAVLRCVSVSMAEGVSEKGGMIVINENFGDGTVCFSYVNMDAYDETELSLVEITWEPLCSPAAHYQITSSGVGVVDADQNPISLEYVTDSDCVFIRTVVPPACLVDGYTDHVCACGENFQTDTAEKLGHDIRQISAKEETCTEVGWDAYEGCIRCDYGAYVEIPALGHDEINHAAQAQSCLGIGWESYVTCSRCDYSTYAELPALGHRVIVSSQEIIDPIQVSNDSDVPFVLENGIYYSNNHDPNSSSEILFTAQQTCTVKVIYGVSSESSCDRLYVLRNSNQLAAISGTGASQRTRTLTLTAGTVLTVRYTKNGSVDAGEDRGWVMLEYDITVNNTEKIVPAETLEPDCTDPIVCSYCDTVVKENVDHKYEPDFIWSWDHASCEAVFSCVYDCGEEKTVACTVSEVSSNDRQTTHEAVAYMDGQRYTDTMTCDHFLVCFQDWDGRELSSAYYHAGSQVTAPADPEREAENFLTYTFAGWGREIGLCAGDATYTAIYNSAAREYTVIFKDWDGTVLSEETYYWAETITFPQDPTRPSDNTYTYSFAGWDGWNDVCYGDAVYVASYYPTYIDYLVTFEDWNGTVISQSNYHWGDIITVPTAPERGPDSACTYAFAGWDQAVVPCAGRTTYTATYIPTYIDYTVIFQNWDGTELSKKTYHWGDTVVPPAAPNKEGDGTTVYYFAGWDKAVVNCDGDAVYQAVFTSEHHHDYKAQVTLPNCTEQGFTTYTCVCGHSYQSDFVDALGHNYQKTVTDPTYTQQGYTDYVCHCGSTDRRDFKEPSGLPAPTVKISMDPDLEKHVLSWDVVAEATEYEVYRATSKKGKYTKVATVEESTWLDASASVGKTYYYKVKAVYSPDTSCNSGYSNIVSIAVKCDTPEISAENNSSGKPVISWEKVSGAKKYTIYRATSETGKYKKLGTTTKLSYTDSKAKAGNTYYYKVIANASKSSYNSGYSNIVSCGVICGTPSITVKIDTNTGKPNLSWKKVDGAAKYAIYRDGELLATVTAVTYADTAAAIDTQYSYAVQALGKTEDLNGQLSKAVSATSGIAKPAIKGSVDAVSGKPVITWDAVEGAVKYEVYRSTKSGKSYKLVATVETLSYTDETVSAGKTYYYKVKAIGEVSKSADSSYVKLTGKCATPVISVTNDAKGKPYITWSKVSGAKKYTVYRASSETGKYKKLGTTTKAYYTDSKASAGTTYFYKIIANASSSKNNSPYSNIVSCGVSCATPAVKLTTNASGQPVLSWSKVSGAVKYEIYLLDAEDYVILGTVTGTTWTDEACAIGEGRYYGVRAIAAQETYNSEVSEAVFARGTCATPKPTGKVGDNKKPVISWGEVDGAVKYAIYRSTSKNKGYKLLSESETLNYEDLTAKKGKTYYYKVVAVGDGVQSTQSNYVKVKSK